ncbi:MAG: Asp23/Gls24 family envelope stress response protein [Peptoniphilaceae bacterium]|nr:Asp23/Gls24 family envelope stress response protein [Peptoniphilaceae bacterium]MDY6019395.1 Asp23/Gls24 family envelope stress response protein [Anaerococcus sp.]
MSNSFKNGSVKIANETIEFIAKEAAEEINGVYASEGGSLNKEKQTQAKLVFTEKGIEVNLFVVLFKNVEVRKTVKKIQERVKKQIEVMTGITVKRVNVSVEKLIIL